MTILTFNQRILQAKASALDAGFNGLDAFRFENPVEQGVKLSLDDVARAIYGGCHQCVTLIEYGRVPLREAITNRTVACVPAVLMRPLLEMFAKAHWMFRVADPKAAEAFRKAGLVKRKKSDAAGASPPDTPAKSGRDFWGLRDFADACQTDERKRSGGRNFLNEYGTTEQVKKLHQFVHGGPDAMLGGFPTKIAGEFSDARISDMIFVFGGVMFMAFRNIVEIAKIGDEALGAIRMHQQNFYSLFPPSRQVSWVIPDP